MSAQGISNALEMLKDYQVIKNTIVQLFSQYDDSGRC